MKTITIKDKNLHDKEVTITKPPFKTFMKMAGIMASIKLDDADAFVIAADQIIELITLTTNLDKAWLEENLEMGDAFTLLSAIREESGLLSAMKQATETLKPKGAEAN